MPLPFSFPFYRSSASAGGGAATFLATTTGAETLTIAALTVSRSTVVDWGDGSTSTYTGSGARTHDYAGAGTWTVTIADALAVTALTLSSNKVTLNSYGIAPMANMVTFIASTVKAGTFNSADVSAWRPSTFQLYSMPAGYAGTFNSADVSAWRPTTFYLFLMPSGYAGTFNSADVSAWRPTTFYLFLMPSGYAGTFNSADVRAWRPRTFYLYSMPSGYAGTFNSADVSAWRPTEFSLRSMPVATYTITITANGFAAWSTGLNDFRIDGNSLSQAQVDAILWDLYQAAKVPRTATGGNIDVSGTNAAPSGTYQAASACPVTSSTDGKEIAHELINDTCAVGFHKWTTVTTTA